MAQAGKMRLSEKVPGEPALAGGPGNGVVCVFEMMVGDRFSVARPATSREQQAPLIDMLCNILEDEEFQ